MLKKIVIVAMLAIGTLSYSLLVSADVRVCGKRNDVVTVSCEGGCEVEKTFGGYKVSDVFGNSAYVAADAVRTRSHERNKVGHDGPVGAPDGCE